MLTTGVEPISPAWKAGMIPLHYASDILGVGFEPTKHFARGLKPRPFSQTQETQYWYQQRELNSYIYLGKIKVYH